MIPVQPSAADIWSAETVVAVCETHGTPAAFVLSRAIVGTREAGVATDSLDRFDIPTLETLTCQRIAYVRAMGEGISVLDLSGADEAAEEIRNLSSEVLSHLNHTSNE